MIDSYSRIDRRRAVRLIEAVLAGEDLSSAVKESSSLIELLEDPMTDEELELGIKTVLEDKCVTSVKC